MDLFQVLISVVGVILTAVMVAGITFISLIIQKHISATEKNTVELAVLSSRITSIFDDVKSIPKMQTDINRFHQWKKDHSKEHSEGEDDDH
jgi:hypothetical protein